jgi:arylsulfatase A-like enzyme
MKKPYNLVILMADQLRHDCVGCARLRDISTPNIDALAAGGIRYTRAFAPSPVCAPARQALFSGRHPDSFGAIFNYDFMPTNTIKPGGTWPEQLGELGYDSAYVGKWHCSPDYGPADFGYRERVDFGSHKALMRELYADLEFTGGWLGCKSPVALEHSDTHWLASRAAERIGAFAKGGKPFHMYVDFGVPHLPCRPSAPFCDLYDKPAPPWDGFGDTFDGKPYIHRQQPINWGIDGYAWSDFEPAVRRYYAMVSQLDDAIGRILRALGEAGLRDDTIVVFTSDHGDMCGSHGMLDKHCVMYEDIVRVPLVMSAPGVSPFVCGDFVSNALDLPVTLPALLGLPEDGGAHGLPLSTAIGCANGRKYITSSGSGQQFGLFTTRMIRDDRYKYVWNPTDTDEFYDLEADPGEKRNLIRMAEHGGGIARMRRELHAELASHGDPFVKSGWLDGQLLEGKKSLRTI